MSAGRLIERPDPVPGGHGGISRAPDPKRATNFPRVIVFLWALFAVPLVYGASFPLHRMAWIGWVGFIPWFVAMRIAPTRLALLICWVSTFLGSYACTPWLASAVANYYQQPLALGVLLFAGVWTITIAPFVTAFVLCYRALAQRPSMWLPLLAAAGWAGAELARTRLLIGNPFGVFGYSQVGFTPLAQIADVTGVYGLTVLPMAFNAALAEVWLAYAGSSLANGGAAAARRPHLPSAQQAWFGFGIATAAVLLTLLYGSARIAWLPDDAAAAPIPVAVVQGNLDLGSQWRQEFYGRNLDTYLRLTVEALRRFRPQIVFWPESSMTFFLDQEPLYRAAIAQVLLPANAELLAGGPRAVAGGVESYYNAAFLLSPRGDVVALYDKQRLLPFAEYFPFESIALLRRHFARVREFTPGGPAHPLPTAAGAAGILVCNEAMFGEMAAERVRAGANYLVTLANDSWLGDRQYAEEVFDMARLRAVEQRRYMVRASTSGPSAIIDPLGRVVAQTADEQAAVLGGAIRPAANLTFYARWGDVFGVLCVILPLAIAVGSQFPRRRGQQP